MNVLEQTSPAASQLIQGGRIRKTSKGLISFAPFLASASALALGAILATTSPVEAGTCTETGTTGEWACTGAAGDNEGGIQITNRANQGLSITGDDTFGLSTDGSGFLLNLRDTNTGAVDINLPHSNNDITSRYSAIFVRRGGTGAVTITTGGTLNSTGGRNGAIFIRNDGPGGVTITSTGTLISAREGIDLHTGSNPAGEINITANDIMADSWGILIGSAGSSATDAVTITTTGTVTSATQEAIRVNHSGAGDVNITTVGTVTASAAAKDAISVNHTGTGNIILAVNGSVVGGSSAKAVNLSTSSGNATIILGADASFMGDIDTSGVMGTTSLEIGGTDDRSFDIGNILTIGDERNFDKNGEDTLTITGTHAVEDAFTQTNINEGKLVWGGTEFQTANLAIADGATLGVTGSSSFADTSAAPASVALSGRLELTGSNANITVGQLTGDSDSDIDIDVDFSGGDEELADARLTATSVIGTIPVNIKSVNEFQLPDDDEDGAITLENFLNIADSGAFRAGDVLDNGNYDFDLVYDSGNGWWNLVARPEQGGSIEEALYESLPAALAQLASLESYRQRLQGRRHGGNRSVWAKVSNAFAEFEPASTALATYETGNTVAEFGIDAPLAASSTADCCTVSASVAFGEAVTDVVTGGITGEIETSSVKTAISANWKHNGAYVDGQLQYAIFRNKVKATAKLANESATAYSAGVEIGYGVDIAGFLLTPAAQLVWTSVDFGTFTDIDRTQVELNDGSVLAGRAGVGVEVGRGDRGVLLRGHADVLMPVDGDVGTRAGRAELISEREDPTIDVGIGATYSWGNAYTLSADFSTQQGEEVGGYAGNIGLKYKF